MKNTGCVGCHQLGQESTRTIPPALGTFATGADAWKRRVQSGQAGREMFGQLNGLGRDVRSRNFGDWTDRIAKGELPLAKPQRPQGVERNIVVTLRDWMNEKQYLHDLISSDRRNPDGERLRTALRIAGVQLRQHPDSRSGEERRDDVQGAGARSEDAAQPRARTRRGARRRCSRRRTGASERIWDTRVNNHNSMFDRDGRLWLAASVRGARQPGVLQGRAPIIPSAKAFPIGSRRAAHLAVLDPKTKKYTFVDTCFSHAPSAVRLRRQRHAVDERRRPGRRLAEHEDVRRDRRRREVAGLDGARARHQRQRQARRLRRAGSSRSIRAKDKRIERGVLRGDAEPGRRLDLGRVRWASPARSCGSCPDRIRRRRRSPRSTTCRCPASACAAATSTARASCGCRSRSGHLGSFDRRKCKGPLNGPKATGDHCPEGWSFYQYPGPGFRASATTAPSRATTRGSISTTRSGSATTCRCRRAI